MTTTDRCHRCDRPEATDADWSLVDCPRCNGDLSDAGCKCGWDRERCWGAESCERHAVDWRQRYLDERFRVGARFVCEPHPGMAR